MKRDDRTLEWQQNQEGWASFVEVEISQQIHGADAVMSYITVETLSKKDLSK